MRHSNEGGAFPMGEGHLLASGKNKQQVIGLLKSHMSKVVIFPRSPLPIFLLRVTVA